jgi:hypothetical protein
MSSPFQKKFSAKSPIGETPLTKKSPCYQKDLREGDYTVTKSTTGLSGEKIATERQAIIPGTPGKTYEQAGVDPAEAKAYWDANPEKYEEYKAGQEDRTVTQTRDVSVDSKTIKSPKLYPNPFKGQSAHRGIKLDPMGTKSDSLTSKVITNIYKKAKDLKGYEAYLTEHNLKKSEKPGKGRLTTRNTQNISSWATKK